MDQHVVRRDRADHLAVVDGQVLEPRIGGLDEDLGLVAGGAQHALDAEHLVADGVAVAERREHLVDARPALHAAHADAESVADARGRRRPLRRNAREDVRGRRQVASRRANQPGSGSIAAAAGGIFALQPVEHVEVLPLDHRPRVVRA